MSAQIPETVPEIVESKLEGGKVEAVPEVIQGGETAPAAEAVPELKGGDALKGGEILKGGDAEKAELAGGELEGGSKKRKTRKDKGHKRGRYSSKASSRLRSAIRKLEETPGGEAVYVEGTAMKCRRGHRYSRRHGVCVKHIGGSPRKLRSYNRHREESEYELSSSRKRRKSRLYSRRHRSRSRSHRRTRSGRKY